MLPGKTYTPEEILRLARKRVWWVLVPLAVVSAAATVVARQLPDVYRSDALVLVMPQRVPDSYVRSTNTTSIQDRLQASRQTVLSRAQIEQLISEFSLQTQEGEDLLLSEVIARVRSNIDIAPVRGDAFRVSYSSQDPRTAQAVASRIAGLFIDWSLTERRQTAQRTSEFFEDLLEATRLRLADIDKRRADFVRQYYGELPGQLQSNMQALSSTELQIQSTLDSIQRDAERRADLARELRDLQTQPVLPDPTAAALPAGANAPQTAAAALADARAKLSAARIRGLRPNHPDIQILERQIRDLEVKAEAEALATPLSSAGGAALPPAEVARLKRIDSIEAEIEALDRQIAAKEAEEQRLRDQVALYRGRIDATPTRETEMIELNRDYDTLDEQYRSLLRKKEDSNIAEQIETREVGETFKILDPASLPQAPVSPNRPLISLAGMGAGLGFGLALVALFEYRDRSFQVDDEVTRLTGLPVLAVVPLMLSDADRRSQARKRWLARIVFGGTVAGCLAVVLLTLAR